MFGGSHDRDTTVAVELDISRWYETAASHDYDLEQTVGGETSAIGAITVDDPLGDIERTCLERDADDHECLLFERETRGWIFRLAYPQFPTQPNERLAHLAVSPLQVVSDSAHAWETCSFDPTHECREVRFVQLHKDAKIYEIDLESPTPTLRETIEGETVFWIGHGESGSDVVLGRGNWHITLRGSAEAFHQTGNPIFEITGNVDTCGIEYRERSGLAPIGMPIDDLDACNFGALTAPHISAGTGTIAPSILSPGLVAGGDVSATVGSMRSMTGGAASVPLPIHGATLEGLVQLVP